MNFQHLGMVAPLTALTLMGQSTGPEKRTWTGLLVAAGCQTSASTAAGRDHSTKPSQRGASVNQDPIDTLARVTTPPVDDKGTRGKATINNTAAQDEANRTASPGATSKPGDGAHSGNAANSMDTSCQIGQSTEAFALQLGDGSLLRFDDAGNHKIALQLQSGDRLQRKTKIFRTKVKGSLQGDAISIDSIKL